jgi:hypothetical protein
VGLIHEKGCVLAIPILNLRGIDGHILNPKIC